MTGRRKAVAALVLAVNPGIRTRLLGEYPLIRQLPLPVLADRDHFEMVKLVEVRAVLAGRWPAGPALVSTNSAQWAERGVHAKRESTISASREGSSRHSTAEAR